MIKQQTCSNCARAESRVEAAEVANLQNVASAAWDRLKVERQRDELLTALKRIVKEGGCTCTGYYKCGGCPERAIYIAEDAIAKAEGK